MKEGPHGMACTWAEREDKEEDEEEEENTTFAVEASREMGSSGATGTLAQRQVGVSPIKTEEIERAYAWCSTAMDSREVYWARGCSECEVELDKVKYPIHALLDSGSEVNIISKSIYEQGQWAVDRHNGWGVRSVNAEKNNFWGACPGVKIRIGDIVEPINLFVHESLPMQMILGQPFITEFRMATKVLDDGAHVAMIKSRDGTKLIQFPTVQRAHPRNRLELREGSKKELEGMDFE